VDLKPVAGRAWLVQLNLQELQLCCTGQHKPLTLSCRLQQKQEWQGASTAALEDHKAPDDAFPGAATLSVTLTQRGTVAEYMPEYKAHGGFVFSQKVCLCALLCSAISTWYHNLHDVGVARVHPTQQADLAMWHAYTHAL